MNKNNILKFILDDKDETEQENKLEMMKTKLEEVINNSSETFIIWIKHCRPNNLVVTNSELYLFTNFSDINRLMCKYKCNLDLYIEIYCLHENEIIPMYYKKTNDSEYIGCVGNNMIIHNYQQYLEKLFENCTTIYY